MPLVCGICGDPPPSDDTAANNIFLDCYKPVAGEILVIATVVKNTYGFGMTFFINDWAASSGYQIMWLIPVRLP